MSRSKIRLSVLAPLTLVAIFGCDTSQILGTDVPREKVVGAAPPAIQVVTVENSLPKPPKYSPYVIDHGTLSPYSSPPPDPTPTPSKAPATQPSPQSAPSPSPSPPTSPVPTASPTSSPEPVGPALNYGTVGYVSTLVAGGTTGKPKDGTGPAAVLGQSGTSVGLAYMSASTTLVMSDAGANWLRKVTTPAGVVSLLAGDPAGTVTPTDKSLNLPGGCAYDGAQNVVYVSDTGNNRIFRVSPTDGTVTSVVGSPTLAGVQATPTFGDGSGSGGTTLATMFAPLGLAFDSAKKFLYVADSKFHVVRKVDPTQSPAVVSTLAGVHDQKGPQVAASEAAASTKFDTPSALAMSVDGTTLFVADAGNNVIRAIDINGTTAGNVTVFAGTGTAGSTDGPTGVATFTKPCALAADATRLFVGEQGTPRLRVVDLTTRRVTTALGTAAAGQVNGDHSKAQFTAVTGLTAVLDASNKLATLYAYDSGSTTTGGSLGAQVVSVTGQ